MRNSRATAVIAQTDDRKAQARPAPFKRQKRRTTRLAVVRVEHKVTTKSAELTIKSLKVSGEPRIVEIDFSEFKLRPNSLLILAARSAPFPSHKSNADTFRRYVYLLKETTEALDILRRPLTDIATGDIRLLFTFIDELVAGQGIDEEYQASTKARLFFMKMEEPLADGRRIKDCGFRSGFKQSPNRSPAKNLTGPRPKGLPKLGNSKFDSLEERNENALQYGLDVQRDVLDCVDSTISKHRKVLALIAAARRQGLPTALRSDTRIRILNGRTPGAATLAKQNPHDLLRIKVALLDAGVLELSPEKVYFPFIRLEELRDYCASFTAGHISELLLSEHFLPRLVVIGCAVAIMATSALNSDVVQRLSMANIERRGNFFILVGLKGRSGRLQAITTADNEEDVEDEVRIQNPTAIAAIELLINNASYVAELNRERKLKLFEGEDFPLLFSLVRRGHAPKCERLDFYHALGEFWAYNNATHLSPNELRRLCAHIEFLSPEGSIFTTQALLDHADIKTTLEYVNTKIVAGLLDDNIMRYMAAIEATILWATNREGLLQSHGLSQKDVQPLLFPVSTSSAEPCAVDQWISSLGKMTLPLGMDELEHCAAQYSYYIKNYTRLATDNPRKFIKVDLPRIVFCCALRKCMLVGPYASVFQAIEEKLN